MKILIQAIFIFLDTIKLLIIIDIILSWLILLGINFRPKFVRDIINPIYTKVRKIIPTTIGMLDFSPIIIILGVEFIKYIIIVLFPAIVVQIN